MNMDYFTSYESQLGEKVYTGIEFTAVYDIKYNKQLHLVGTLGNSGTNEITSDGKLVLNSGDTNVDVITNFNLTINNGVAALLLIPEYDMDAFSIKDISINGKLVYSNGQSLDPASTSTATAEILKNFDVSITGNETSSDLLKILLDNTTPDSSTSEQDVFIQIVYTMKEAIGGEYKFGFVTNTPKTTDSIATHGDRSEAYGTYDPDASKDNDAYKFNELDITVDNSQITVIIRATGEITIADQPFVYNAQ